MRHPSFEALARFVDGALPEEEREAVVRELGECAECRAAVGLLARRGAGREQRDAALEHAVTVDPDLAEGTRIGGRYRVVRPIGRGGMGRVYEVEHELLGRRLALKMLHPMLATRADAVRRFLDEARAAASLGHPGIVDVVDLGRTESDAPFLVMELLVGETLESRLERGPLDVSEVVLLGRALADALAAAHARGIVHRDVKPLNVVLVGGDAARPKLLDFGVAKLREREGSASGALVGTPRYMAPEQWLAAPDVDARADVFAVGVVLFRALTGTLPYAWSDFVASLAATPRPPALPSEVPARLAAVVMTALSIDRDARQLDGARLRDALVRATTRAPASMPPGAMPSHERPIWLVVATGALDPERVFAPWKAAGVRWETHDALEVLVFEGTGATRLDLAQLLYEVGPLERDVGALVIEEIVPSAEVALATHATALASKLDRGARGVHLAERAACEARGLVVEPAGGGLVRLRSIEITPRASHFVGRARELAQLLALTRVPGSVGWITGPVGVGKSALLSAWAGEARTAGRVLLGRATISARARPLATLRALFAPTEPLPTGGVRETADQARLAITTGLARMRESGPVLVGIDDAQWLDPESVRALSDLAGAEAIALVLAAREGEADAIAGELAAATISLRGLHERDVAAWLLAEGQDARLAPELTRRTGGHPLFVRQLLALGLDRAVSEWPAGIEAAVQARLDAVAPNEAHAWRVAAVVGPVFTVDELASLGVPDASLAVRALAARNIVVDDERPAGPAVERALRFSAAALREVAYAHVDELDRRALHAAIAALRQARPEMDLAEVASHWDRAGEEGRARSLYARAALAGDGHGADACASWAARAIALGAEGSEREELELVRIDALDTTGQLVAALAALDALVPTLDESSDAGVRARLQRGLLLQRTGRGEAALLCLGEAEVLAERAAARPETRARAIGKRAVALAYAGRLEEAQDGLARAERLVLKEAPKLRAEAAVWRAQVLGLAGDLGDRRDAYWVASELYREAGQLRLAAGAHLNLADTYNQLGAYDEAERALVRGIEACRALGVRVVVGYGTLNLGWARMHLGHADAARAALEEASAIAERTGERRLARFSALYLARLDERCGRLSEALARLEALLEAREDAGDESIGITTLALAAVARTRLARSEPAEALDAALRAYQSLERLGGLEEGEADVHLALGRALAANGRTAEAEAAYARGVRFVRGLARRIADPEWRTRLLSDVEPHRTLLEGVATPR